MSRPRVAESAPRVEPIVWWRNPVAWLFIGWWLFVNLVDTIWADRIPYASPARMLLPVVLLGLWTFERPGRRSGLELGTWVGLIAAVGALSSVFAAVPVLGFIKLGLYISMLAPILLSRSLRDSFLPPASGFYCLAATSLVMIAGGLAMFPSTGTGFYDNPNKLGMLAVCTWPTVLLLTRRPQRLIRYLGWFGLAGCAALCILPHSRGATVGLAAGLTFYVALRISPTVRSLIISALVVALLGWVVYSMDGVFAEYAMKNRETILGSREMIWQETVRAWLHSPMLGYGFGLSWILQPEDAALVFEAGRMSWFTVEFGNSTLAMLCGGGIAIAGLFYGLIAHVLLAGMRSLRIPGVQQANRELQFLLIAAILGMLVHAQCEAWLMAPLTWPTLIFWLYVAVSAGLSARIFEQMPREPVRVPRPRHPDARAIGLDRFRG